MSNRWNVCIFSNSGLLCSRYAHFSRRLHGLIFRPQRNRVNYLFSPLPVQLLHHLQQLLSACPQMLLRSRPFVACKPLAVLFCLLCNVIILHEAMTIEIEIHMLIGRFLYGNGQLRGVFCCHCLSCWCSTFSGQTHRHLRCRATSSVLDGRDSSQEAVEAYRKKLHWKGSLNRFIGLDNQGYAWFFVYRAGVRYQWNCDWEHSVCNHSDADRRGETTLSCKVLPCYDSRPSRDCIIRIRKSRFTTITTELLKHISTPLGFCK